MGYSPGQGRLASVCCLAAATNITALGNSQVEVILEGLSRTIVLGKPGTDDSADGASAMAQGGVLAAPGIDDSSDAAGAVAEGGSFAAPVQVGLLDDDSADELGAHKCFCDHEREFKSFFRGPDCVCRCEARDCHSSIWLTCARMMLTSRTDFVEIPQVSRVFFS